MYASWVETTDRANLDGIIWPDFGLVNVVIILLVFNVFSVHCVISLPIVVQTFPLFQLPNIQHTRIYRTHT